MYSSSEDNKRRRDEFIPTITTIFSTAKWFGIPVYGGRGFLCLTLPVLICLIAIEVRAVWKLIRGVAGFSAHTVDSRGVTARLSGAVFYGNALLSFMLSWKFLRAWERLLSKHWLQLEIRSEIYVRPDEHIKTRVVLVSSFVTLCAFVEHVLSMMAATGLNCPPSEYFMRYILSSHGFMLHPYEYNIWVAIPIFVMSNIATILWNFQDLIVILTSMGLTSRYYRLNLFVKRFVTLQRRTMHLNKCTSKTITNVNTWRRLREAYAHQAELVRKIDKELGVLLFLCNLNNFYFIVLQLFLGLRKSEGSMINRIYYFVSLGWLIFRACSVVLAASDVNLHSQRALCTVCQCPSIGYNVEIKRLKYQLINDDVVLTGMGFFLLNRSMLLQVAAAVVKYELILLQFEK